MFSRVLTLLRARLASQREGALLPVAALLMQALISATICGLVRDGTSAFAYALVALSVSAALIAVPLLGELAPLLVADETGDWVRALPVRASEIHLARTLHLLIALSVLSLGALVPAAVLAPSSYDLAARATLVAMGLAQALALAAVLLCLQAALRGRAQALLVIVQTAVFVGVIVGAAVGLRAVPRIVAWQTPLDAPGIAAFPPAWFASAIASGAPLTWRASGALLGILALAVLIALPAPVVNSARRGQPALSRALAPLRKFAARFWVRGRERAAFEFVFDALPKERDFVLRSYPLVAVPIAFLFAGSRGEHGRTQDALLALLLFAPAAYLPLLSAHVPASLSHRARWLLDTAPIERGELDSGAFKAIAIRFLLPLYCALVLIGIAQGGATIVLWLALPAWLVAVQVLRRTWRLCVSDVPLSTAPDELYVNLDWIGVLGGLGLALTAIAIASARLIDSWPKSLLVTAVLVVIELAADRGARKAAQRAVA